MRKFERITTTLEGISLVRPTVFNDDRGYFLETYNRIGFAEMGIKDEFVQDNVSHSAKGVIRGLHFQSENAQGKLVRVLNGKIFDVVVDIRKDSPTYGHHIGIELTAQDPAMLFVPVGFAHGFMALEDGTDVMYKVTDFYSPQHDAGLRWNDPDLSIPWPLVPYGIASPVVSSKDAVLPYFRDITSPFQYVGKKP